MTDNSSPALLLVQAYHRKWTSGDLDAAMEHVADDVFCRAPGTDLSGKEAYHAYLEGFLQVFTGWTAVAAYGGEEHALLFYYPHTAATTTAPAAERFTVRNGLISENLLVFDRLSYGPPPQTH